jgi:hypothetical protein
MQNTGINIPILVYTSQLQSPKTPRTGYTPMRKVCKSKTRAVNRYLNTCLSDCVAGSSEVFLWKIFLGLYVLLRTLHLVGKEGGKCTGVYLFEKFFL